MSNPPVKPLGWLFAVALSCGSSACSAAGVVEVRQARQVPMRRVVPPPVNLPSKPVEPDPGPLTDEDVDDMAVPASVQVDRPLGYPAQKPLTINGTMQARCRQYRPLFERIGEQTGLDATLMMAIAWVESGFNPGAVSSAGALGIMQMLPRTAESFGCDDPQEPRCAILAASGYMSRLLRQFDGQMLYALCAYHAGSVRPMRAYRAGLLPTNVRYAERIMEARSRLDREGCDVR